jgi:cytochrome oxidase Cu insertion factor (SCO1/SenC/PrrC family)
VTIGACSRAVTLATTLVLALVIAGCDAKSLLEDEFNGTPLKPSRPLPTGQFSRADGTPYDLARETAGHVTLIYFGYTHCPDICPVQLMNVAAGLREAGPAVASRTRVVVITVDPARDTGAVFDKWVKTFDTTFAAVRMPKAEVDEAIARLGLAPPSGARTDSTSDPAHASAVIAFVRGEGRYIYNKDVSPKAWAWDLRKLSAADAGTPTKP